MARGVKRPLTVGGVEYESQSAAAHALGVTPATVHHYVSKGRPEDLLNVTLAGRRTLEPTPVRIRGKVYPSARDAAKDLGLSVQSIYSALHRGTEDTVGLGHRRPPGAGRPQIAVKVGKFHFASQSECDRYLGVFRGFTRQCFNRDKQGMQTLLRKLMEKEQENAKQ